MDSYHYSSNDKLRILVILNRPIESDELFIKLVALSDKIVIADGAANIVYQFCLKSKSTFIIPDYILGDFDSISQSARDYF